MMENEIQNEIQNPTKILICKVFELRLQFMLTWSFSQTRIVSNKQIVIDVNIF